MSLDAFTVQEDLELAIAMTMDAATLALSAFGFSTARRKYDGTLVTETDEAVDRLITERLTLHRSGDAILSEEQATWYDPALRRTWVIDPLDGTTNFARGMPIWGISIGLLVDGSPQVGVLNFPVLGDLYHATRGGGAFLNGSPIETMAARLSHAQMEDDQVFLECTRTRKRFILELPFKSRIFGSAAYHLCKVAEGCAVGGVEATPKLWDIGAAALILEEAGGAVLPFSGDPIFPLRAPAADYVAHSMPLIHAASLEVATRVRQRIQPRPLPSAPPVEAVVVYP